MFDRLKKPFLTVETGEAYQPVRLTYLLTNKESVARTLEKLTCIKQEDTSAKTWQWYWQAECHDMHFESVATFQKNSEHSVQLGKLVINQDKLFIHLHSFKRACLAVPFFCAQLKNIGVIQHADFINKVFAIDEPPSQDLMEGLRETELKRVLQQYIEDYHQAKERCEHAATAKEASEILFEYSKKEMRKRLPYAERYSFETLPNENIEIAFLAFYIFMHGREIVAIKRWLGQSGYQLQDAADEMIQSIFGDMGLDLIE